MGMRGRIFSAVSVLVLAGVMTGGVLYQEGYIATYKHERAANVEKGTLDEAMTKDQEVPAKGQLLISINTAPVFENGDSEGNIRIENPEQNRYAMWVEITLSESDKTVYRTGVIRPGEYIEKDKLDKKLEAGEYSASAQFTAVDKKTGEELGSVKAPLVIKVLN